MLNYIKPETKEKFCRYVEIIAEQEPGSVGRARQGRQNPCGLIMVWTTDKKQIDNKKLYILLARLLDHAPPGVAY